MLLTELIAGLDVLETRGDILIDIDGIAYDSRKVKKRYVFICIDGTAADGHEYAAQALDNGAAAFIAQKELALPDGIPVVRTNDTRKALAYVSDKFYGHLSSRFRLTGITGTKGKTTTTFMVKSILEASVRKVGLIGTLGTRIGDRIMYTERTTPESLDLQELFIQMVEEGVDDVIMEVSSQGLALKRVSFCEFDTGVFTNLSRDHISPSEHASMDEYLAAKCMLFKICKKGLVNADSKYAEHVAGESKCRVLTYGIDNDADIRAVNIKKLPKSVEFDIVSPWYGGRLKVNIPGKFSIYNALAAAGSGDCR
jgi:UDP-N-acetylmuramoyl-L-alanyl-D-glutamate--2,6-diaminopimelate ligase